MTGTVKGLFASLACSALFAVVAGAQQQNAIIGLVTDRATSSPIGDANVVVVGTQRGTRTTDQGRYRLAGVTPGTFSVRVSRLGYAAVTRPVTVLASGDVTVDFQMTQTAATIDEVVISATGQAERKRENGNDVGLIKPGQDVSLAVTPTLTSVLESRTPGVTITQNSGTAGTSARIRIRGANSVSLANEPLLIVDGIRVENNPNDLSLGIGGQTINRFDDINPEDIENIEILKGPAASALYGTAAANGVIQVTTKRGRSGRTQWRSFAELGSLNDPTNYPDNYYVTGFAGLSGSTVYGASCTIDRRTQNLCRPDQIHTFNPIKAHDVQGTGHNTTYGLSVSGGADAAQYFLSGDAQHIQGISQPNKVGAYSLRANVNAQLKPNLTTSVTANYIERDVALPYNDNNIFGVVPNGVLGHAFDCSPATPCPGGDTLSRGFYSVPPSTYYYISNQQQAKKFVGGSNATWQPLSWLTASGQAGLDVNNELDENLTPSNIVTYINQGLIDGSEFQQRTQNLDYSANGNLTATYSLPWNIQASTVAGSQYLNEQVHFTSASGRQLVPGTGSLATAGAGKTINESNQTVITVGGYGREQLAWRDRLFLTGSLRADENSAFGKNFKLAYYPAASGSWVVSEEPWFKDAQHLSWVNEFRLRSAYGQSGQRPAFRQANTYLSGVAVADKGSQELTAVVIGGVGNANLRPEKSSEYEFGFDASFLNSRLGIQLTRYSKTTRDALIARTLAPSLGIGPTTNANATAAPQQFVNVGEVYNSGNELALNATPLSFNSLKLDFNVTGSTLTNRLNKLGGIPSISFNGGLQEHIEGYTLGGFWARKILSYQDLDKNGILSRVNCPTIGGVRNPQIAGGPACEVILSPDSQFVGSVLPTREVSVTPALTLFQNLRVSALFNYRGGFYVYNNTEEFRCTASSFSNCRAANDPTASLKAQAAMIARLMGSSAGYIEKGDFTKLREVAITLTAPGSLASRLGSDGIRLTVAGRNLHTWTKYTGFDPEINASTGNFTQFDFLTQPALRTWITRLDVSF